MEKFFVYVLYSLADKGIYIGQTKNVEKRLKQHNYGKVKSTKSRRPWRLLYWEEVGSREAAVNKEKEWKETTMRRRFRERARKKFSEE